jgi:hypothetical protein
MQEILVKKKELFIGMEEAERGCKLRTRIEWVLGVGVVEDAGANRLDQYGFPSTESEQIHFFRSWIFAPLRAIFSLLPL